MQPESVGLANLAIECGEASVAVDQVTTGDKMYEENLAWGHHLRAAMHHAAAEHPVPPPSNEMLTQVIRTGRQVQTLRSHVALVLVVATIGIWVLTKLI